MLGDKVVQTRPTFKKKKEEKKERKKKHFGLESPQESYFSPGSKRPFIKGAFPTPPPPLLASLANSSLHYLTREQKIVRNIWKRNNVSLWYEGG